MLTFKKYIISEGLITGTGYKGPRHFKKYIEPFFGQKNTHKLGKASGHLPVGSDVSIHSGREENGKHYVTVSGKDGKKIEIPAGNLEKPEGMVKRGGDRGFARESELAEHLKKHGLMDPSVATAGSTGGVDFHILDKRKGGAIHHGAEVDKVDSGAGGQIGGESKVDLGAKMGAIALKYSKEKGWHVSPRSEDAKKNFADQIRNATVNGKPLLDHLNEHWGDPSDGKHLPNVTADTTDLSPLHAYMKDHKVDVLHIHSHGTFRGGDSEKKDRTGLGLPAPEGTGRFTIGRERAGGTVNAAFRPHRGNFSKSPMNLMDESQVPEFKKRLGHEVDAPAPAPEAGGVEPESKLKHIKHIEDYLIDNGAAGYSHARNTLLGMHNALQGKASETKLGTKYDGAPSLVFGTNPENGKFFVASKSAFNKNPKINYTPQDIEKNHGHAPGLVEKLKAALEHLPKVTPPGKVFQGDVMHTPSDVEDSGDHFHFTPNTITYSAKKNSPEGKKIANAKIGVAVHTSYEGEDGTLGGMNAKFMPNMRTFGNHPDVHVISTENKPNPDQYSPSQKAEFQRHLDAADQAYLNTDHEAHSTIAKHNSLINPYINYEVRRGKDPSHKEFMKYVSEKGEGQIEKYKTDAARNRMRAIHNERMADISKNKGHFDSIFKVHKHLQDAKNVLVDAAEQNQKFNHSIGGTPTGPEGTVVVDSKNNIAKANNRAVFNRMNALKGKMQAMKNQ